MATAVLDHAPTPAAPRHTAAAFSRFLQLVKARNIDALWSDFNSLPADPEFAEAYLSGKAAMNMRTGATGGFLVPTEMADALAWAALDQIVWPRAMRLPMDSAELEVPCLDVTTAPTSGNTAFGGGLIARWTEEDSAPTAAEPSFRQAQMHAYELTGLATVSNVFLRDAPAAAAVILRRVLADVLAWFREKEFLVGNGVGRPLGAFVGPAAISVTRETASSFTLLDAATMISKLPPRWNLETTCFVVHPTVHLKLFQIAQSAGAALQLIDWKGKPKLALHGIPVETSEAMSALGTARDVGLADWSYYLIGDRSLAMQVSDQAPTQWLKNQAIWRMQWRGNGMPWLNDQITLSNASTETSPFVYLT